MTTMIISKKRPKLYLLSLSLWKIGEDSLVTKRGLLRLKMKKSLEMEETRWTIDRVISAIHIANKHRRPVHNQCTGLLLISNAYIKSIIIQIYKSF